jgi:hypothetical protein
MNKLSLVGMQLPERYKDNFDISSKGSSSGVTSLVNLLATNSGRRVFARNSPHILHPYQRKLVHVIGTTYTGSDSSRYKSDNWISRWKIQYLWFGGDMQGIWQCRIVGFLNYCNLPHWNNNWNQMSDLKQTRKLIQIYLHTTIDNSHYKLIFYLGKKKYTSRKKHTKISKIAKFGSEML